MAIDPDMEPIIANLQAQIDAISAKIDAMPGNELFKARDDFEQALFGAMAGMTDAEQVEYLRKLTAQIGA